ncbi:MAG: hypothetical protein HGGPFJEG_02746 [Ignavibacteria bacterium]|nr:hypothetical protein [Ignavibacteria bacterium]
MKKQLGFFLAAVSLLLILNGLTKVHAQESLYKRLGGYDAIAAVSDDFIYRLATSPDLKKFTIGLNADSQRKLRQHLVDFICSATGGPCFYIGKDMETAHTGLNITKEEWNIGAGLLAETLDKFKVPAKEKEELLGAVSSLESKIVGK